MERLGAAPAAAGSETELQLLADVTWLVHDLGDILRPPLVNEPTAIAREVDSLADVIVASDLSPGTSRMKTLLFIVLSVGVLVSSLAGQAPTVHGSTFFSLQVEDVAEAASWYGQVFGLEQVNDLTAEDRRYNIRILRREGLAVELIQARGVVEATVTTFGIFKTGIYVDDIDAAWRWFSARVDGVDDAVFVDEALSARSFVLRDPWGNRIQIFAHCDGDCGNSS